MKALFDVPAPAKLNLFLHITGRRADGYHLLQSAFMLIDWCDTLHFELRPQGVIERVDLLSALPADDLIVRAARTLQAASGCTQGVRISVEKRIPAQAGLGGGSSDAASCLLALNHLWRLHLPLAQLLPLALRLGADVPFFLHGGNAWVEGIGESLTPLPLPDGYFVVAKPAAGLATGDIFGAPDLKRNTKPVTISGFAAYGLGFGHNDLEPVARRLCPEIDQSLNWLKSKGLAARMTGSGSAVFAPAAVAVDLSDSPSGLQVQLCRNLMVHPLSGWAAG